MLLQVDSGQQVVATEDHHILEDITTARHHQGEIGVAAFPLGLSAEVAVNLLLGVVPDGAGVVKHQIGIQFG